MNICRSPAMAVILDRNLAAAAAAGAGLAVHVSSVGTDAQPGVSRCALAQALIGIDSPTGSARPLSAEIVAGADLILTADSGHRGQVVRIDHSARARTFTLVEAARLATWVVSRGGSVEFARAKAAGESPVAEPGDLRALAEPLPADAAGRAKWLIVEMDAARGLVPRADGRFDYLRVDAIGPDDIPDPHVLGYGLHREATEVIVAAADAWTDALGAVVAG